MLLTEGSKNTTGSNGLTRIVDSAASGASTFPPGSDLIPHTTVCQQLSTSQLKKRAEEGQHPSSSMTDNQPVTIHSIAPIGKRRSLSSLSHMLRRPPPLDLVSQDKRFSNLLLVCFVWVFYCCFVLFYFSSQGFSG